MLDQYKQHRGERAGKSLPPLPLNPEQVAALVELLKTPPAGEEGLLLELLEHRVPAGVDQSAYVKAAFLTDIAQGKVSCPIITPQAAIAMLGTMLGGYNIGPLIDLLKDAEVGAVAAEGLKKQPCRAPSSCLTPFMMSPRRSRPAIPMPAP